VTGNPAGNPVDVFSVNVMASQKHHTRDIQSVVNARTMHERRLKESSAMWRNVTREIVIPLLAMGLLFAFIAYAPFSS
jgi:hypothetical protein